MEQGHSSEAMESDSQQSFTQTTASSDHERIDQVVPSHLSKAAVGTTLCLIISVGLLTAGAFLWFGITTATNEVKNEFMRASIEATNQIQASFEEYVVAASTIHMRCRHRDFSRRDFRELYEYLVDSGLELKAAQFDPLIWHEEREAAEAEASAYYAEFYPEVEYFGFRGFNGNSTSLEPREEQEFYYPIHYGK